MNLCKKNCTCNHCKLCGCPSKIKAIDLCQVQQIPAPPTPAYGNFYQERRATLQENEPMPWNGIRRTAGGITLNPDTVTIEVAQAGDYYIDYYVLVDFSLNTGFSAVMGVFVNGDEVNPIQTRFAFQDFEDDRNLCAPVAGGTIISIPAGGTVQLRNVQPSPITTCERPTLAASITLMKVS
ncbi:hypothetical protein ACIQ1D_18025 [Lysinibacillus xylanilyticus]|uniref:hypothetical protein n=1 Tax=Lysinibacillus xylanilyticus TaxID=582475 RepID=UPI0037F134B7